MLSAFPAKLVDYAVLPTAFTVELYDAISSSDRINKGYMKSIHDGLRAVDSSSVRPAKNLTEVVSTSDTCSKTPVLNVIDVIRLSEVHKKGRGITLFDTLSAVDRTSLSLLLNLRDTFVGEFGITRKPGLTRHDVITPRESISKLGTKQLRDESFVTDLISKHTDKALLDQMAAGDLVRKVGVKPLYDGTRLKEIVAKVEFSVIRQITERLELDKARRVYFLPEEYRYLHDIIMPEDHNIKVDASKVLLALLEWAERKIEHLHYPGPLFERIGITDWIEKVVKKSIRDKVDWAVDGSEEGRGT